jgi:hypothetical protein
MYIALESAQDGRATHTERHRTLLPRMLTMAGVQSREKDMSLKLAIAAASMLVAVTVMSRPVLAAPFAPHGNALAEAVKDTTIELVQGGRCHRWRRECSVRWGFRTPRYHRCMRRNGC